MPASLEVNIAVCPMSQQNDASIIYLLVNGIWYCYDSAGNVLGDGAMGVVYLGFRCDNQDRIAIKKVRDEYAGNKQIRECARNEALMTISHPNIVKMIGYCEYAPDYGPIYILSEYIPGITFEDHVKTRLSVLPVKERIHRIISDMFPILSAIQYLHDNNIVHRDIKPSNLMIDSTSQVKLMDLGVSVPLRDLSANVYEFVGTPEYAAPELIPSSGIERVADARVDIYAIGVTLYELLVGVNPFAGSSYDETLYRQLHMDLPENDMLPAKLFAIIKKATEKKPDLRYGSIAEMNEELSCFLQNEYPESKTTWNVTTMLLIILIFASIAMVLMMQL